VTGFEITINDEILPNPNITDFSIPNLRKSFQVALDRSNGRNDNPSYNIEPFSRNIIEIRSLNGTVRSQPALTWFFDDPYIGWPPWIRWRDR